MSKRLFHPLLIILAVYPLVLESEAQKSTAPNGYYPKTFHGTVFTGRLEATRADVQELTLIYVKGNKTEQFVGRLESPCVWNDRNGTTHIVGVPDLPNGAVLTAFYIPLTSKSGGIKTTENSIFALSYAEVNGNRIPDDKRVVIFCSKQRMLDFKVF